MSLQPFFSIITSTYNRPRLLKRMINSVLEQTYTNWELIIIDDSIDEETQTYIKRYVDHTQIKYQKNSKNIGLPQSRNRGLDIASGDWITFLDDDDFYTTEKTLYNVHLIAKEDKSDWFIGNRIDSNGFSFTRIKKQKESYNWITDFLFGKSIQGDAVHFIKKSFINDTRYRGEHRAEWYFWYDLAKKGNYTHYPIPIITAEYLKDGMSSLGYLRKEHIYQGQQFREMVKHASTWKYLPTISMRYVASFTFVRKLLNRLKAKQSNN